MVKTALRAIVQADANSATSPKENSDVLKRVRDHGRVAKRGTNKKKSGIASGRLKKLRKSGTTDNLTELDAHLPPQQPSPSVSSELVSPADRLVAMDCEMVGTKRGSALAQCTILSYDGEILFHEYVRPTNLIVDYRTRWSGILPHHMKCAVPHPQAVKRIKRILDGKICIGHDLSQDFSVIGLSNLRSCTRDTAHFKPLRTLAGLDCNQHPSLRNLALRLLDRKIQAGCHDSLEDARAALDLYRKHERLWENYLVEQHWDKAVWLQDQYWPQEIVAQC
jgi:DNA polymerase III epsilon subunit-like protein